MPRQLNKSAPSTQQECPLRTCERADAAAAEWTLGRMGCTAGHSCPHQTRTTAGEPVAVLPSRSPPRSCAVSRWTSLVCDLCRWIRERGGRAAPSSSGRPRRHSQSGTRARGSCSGWPSPLPFLVVSGSLKGTLHVFFNFGQWWRPRPPRASGCCVD